jgi:dipeptidyl aminopeptidase/acylaminoacyl peptidase
MRLRPRARESATCTGVALACIIAPLAAAAAADVPKVRASLEELFRDPMYRLATVSPGGRYVASEFFTGLRLKVAVRDIVSGVERNVLTIYEDQHDAWISQLVWADHDSLLITVNKRRRKTGSKRESVTYVVDVRSAADDLERRFYEVQVRGRVVDALPAFEDEILYSPTSDSSSVYRVTLSELPAYTGKEKKKNPDKVFREELRVAQLEDEILDWIVDARGNVRCALATAEDGEETRIWYRPDEAGEWVIALSERERERSRDVIPLGISDGGDKILVATNRDRDLYGLYEYDPVAQALGDLVYEHATAEIMSVIYDYSGAKLLGALHLEAGLLRYAYFESGDEELRDALRAAFPGQSAVITGISVDRTSLSLLVSSSTNPGVFYHFDLATGKATEIGKLSPWLDNNELAEARALRVQSADGTEVEAFLSRPPFVEGPWPLVVLPHGGPIGVMDHRHFNPEVQYLAGGGFAILQVNYRGSGGYGRAFEEAGSRQWGRGIEDDIDAAVDYVIERNWVDAQRMCIAGASYGGYSALMTVARHPGRYRCAATLSGVTDIALMFNSSDWAVSEKASEKMREITGDPDADYEELRTHSPVYNLGRIRAPIFIAHGAHDRRVDVDHAYRLRAMLDLYGIRYRWKLLKDSGHGFANQDAAMRYYIELRRFLAEHLKD